MTDTDTTTAAAATSTTTPVAAREAELKTALARPEREIRSMQRDIDCLQEELFDLEIERDALLDELEDEGSACEDKDADRIDEYQHRASSNEEPAP